MTLEALAGPEGWLPEGLPNTAAAAAGVVLGAAAVTAARATDGAARSIGVRMIDGGIIEVLLPANQEIEGPEARIAGDIVRTLAAGRRMPVLLVITGVVGVSKIGRAHVGTPVTPIS